MSATTKPDTREAMRSLVRALEAINTANLTLGDEAILMQLPPDHALAIVEATVGFQEAVMALVSAVAGEPPPKAARPTPKPDPRRAKRRAYQQLCARVANLEQRAEEGAGE